MAFKGITAFILNNGEGGGGGGGSTNYNDLTNHPQINGNELIGNKTADQLGLLPSDTDIPTKLSDLEADETHRTVTDSEKQSWNNKVDSVSGKGLSTNDYTDEDKTALANKVDKVTGKGLSTNDYTDEDKTALANKVDKVAGKGLSTNDYTDGEKEDVAQIDGLVGTVGSLSSAVGIVSSKVGTLEGEMLSVQDALDTKVDKETGKGLSTNDYSNADKAIVDGVTTALAGKVDNSSVGTANGVAGLDNTGRVPSSQLPSYVDDVLEYASLSAFPATGEGGKIYIALDTNKTYRWSGSAYVEISESLALGETQGTAYEGNKGKANADAIDALETTVEAIPDQIETVVKDAVGWVGKNLLENIATNSSVSNVSFTVNADKSVTVSGNNPTNNYAGIIVGEKSVSYGDVFVASCGSDVLTSDTVRAQIDFYNDSTYLSNIHVLNDDTNITVPQNTTKVIYRIYVAPNYTIPSAITIYPMLRETGASSSYEPYHESVQEMFDSLGTASTKNAISVVTESSDLVESGAVKDIVGWGNKNLCNYKGVNNTVIAKCKNGVTYTFSLTSTGHGGVNLKKNDNSGDEVTAIIMSEGRNSVTFTADSDFNLFMNGYGRGGIGFTDDVSDLQLEVGSTATSYEPYHASVNDTLRDAEVVDSANLWDEVWEYGSISGSDGTNISDSTYIRSKNYIPVDSGNVYKIINGNRTGKVYFIYYNENKTHLGTSAQSVDSNTDFSPNVNTAKYMRFTFLNNGNPYGNDVIFGYANKVTTYEPYYIPLKDVVPNKMSYADNGVLGAKNKLPNMGISETINNVTFTKNSDGTVTANGTASADTTYYILPSGTANAFNFKDGDILSGCPVGGGNNTYRLTALFSGNGNKLVEDTGNGKILDTTEGKPNVSVYIVIKNGVTVSNLVFKPMIRLASDTDPTYQPYAQTNRELTVNKADNSVIAPVENGTNASQAWSVRQHFMNGGVLKEVTNAIAVNEQINSGNSKDVNVSDIFDDLYSNIGILTTPVSSMVANSLPVLKRNITNAFYNGSLRSEIAAGNFKNVRVGDYIIGQATGSTYYVASCDYWVGLGDNTNNINYPSYGTHHLGLMLFKPVGTTALWKGYGYSDKSWRVSASDLGRCPWNADTTADPTDTEAIGTNSTNITRSYNGTNVSAYMGSFIRERIDAILLPQCFQADFGSSNVLKRRNWLSNAINTSAASGARSDWAGIASGVMWTDRFIDLPSEVELYGTRINSSSRDDVGVQCEQLPLFRNARIHDFYPRMDLWTKAVASSSHAATRYSYGFANAYGASSAVWAAPLGCVK